MNLLSLNPADFSAAIAELRQQGVPEQQLAGLIAQHRQQNSPFRGLFDAISGSNEALEGQGRERSAILPLSKPEGMTGWEALRAGEVGLAIPGLVQGLISDTTEAVDMPGALLRGEMATPDQMRGSADTLAGLLTLGGAASMGRGALQPDPTMLRAGGGARSTDLPNIRAMSVEDGIRTARSEPHLIEGGAGSEGLYVGGPRSIQTREDLEAMRAALDETVRRDPRGGDWYDRYRAGVSEVTGGDPRDAHWMTAIEGQYSAGVDPGSELAFSLKDTNSMIATGSPGKPARPAQAEASQRAHDMNDPEQFQLGPKTGEYARLIDPFRHGTPSATGVNDFRHLRNLGYTETDGSAQRNAVGAAGHRFADYETALAVDRANRANLGGRSNWTGEQLQAAPWVTQKADDIYSRRWASFDERVGGPGLGRELAFEEANRTIADFFPKHTAYATHEAQPYSAAGHLPGSATASQAEREAFAADPRSTWATAPGGRDALYAGMRSGDTGYAMRVRPTTQMQGVYEGPDGIEYNPGEVARPLVAFDNSGPAKVVAAPDRGLLDAVEAVRGYVDVQGATPWHKPWEGKSPDANRSLSLTPQADGKLPTEELLRLREIGSRAGLPDVIDRGDGVTMTNFGGAAPLDNKALKGLLGEIGDGYRDVRRVNVDSGYPGYEGTWEQGVGSGAATRNMLEMVNAAPAGARAALNRNPNLAQIALNRIERDRDWSAQWGATRQDIETARRIIGDGPGWLDRLEDALKRGAVLPAIGVAVISPWLAGGSDEPRL